MPLREVLVADPGAARPGESFGSFLVYRKLEQNVRAFKKQEARIAGKLGLKGEDAERAGALLVGRFEDGTPVGSSRRTGCTTRCRTTSPTRATLRARGARTRGTSGA